MALYPHTYRFGAFTLDARERQLLRGGQEVRLRPKVFDTLVYLVQQHGHVVTKNDLLEGVWCGTNVSDEVLSHCIAEMRKALGDDVRHPRFVKTIPLAGYKFVGEVAQSTCDATGPNAGTGVNDRPPCAVAVLPFGNLSRDPDNEYFCDGLSEELINALTKIRRLRVVAHSSSFYFKGRNIDAREIGRQLNVGLILEGSVRRTDDRLRISAQLIETANGYHVWSEQYDRQLSDVFAIQEEIAHAILMRMTPARETVGSLTINATGNMHAYQLYLKGRAFWHRRWNGCLQKAMECFEQAIAADPKFALAYTGLADSFSTLGIWALAPPHEVFPRAASLAEKALQLQPTLAEALASRGLVSLFYDWDWRRAGERLARAVELNPGNALIRLWNGHYFSIVGRWDEAFAEVTQAQDYDVLSPIVGANVGWTFYLAGQQQRALEELRNVLAIDPGNGIGHSYLGFVYAALHRYSDALDALSVAIQSTGGMAWARAALGWVHGLTGARRQAELMISELRDLAKATYVPPSAFALVYLGLEEDDLTFDWLTRCVDERDALMPWMKFMPCFDRVSADPRFTALLDAIGLRHVPAEIPRVSVPETEAHAKALRRRRGN